jgi:hypothetical protein
MLLLSVGYSLYGLFLQNSIFILQTLSMQGTKDLKLKSALIADQTIGIDIEQIPK